MKKTFNILVCGVGGQGTLLASNIIADAAMDSGYDVKKSEIHGMAQRGGSVTSHVRFGEHIESPIMRKGECDILLSFELLESVRSIGFLKPGGTLITNTQKILPMSVSAGGQVYPDNILDVFAESSIKFTAIDAIGKALELGNQKVLNIILLGVLSKQLPEISVETWENSIKKLLKPKLHELNLKAFNLGRNYN
ncbi:MAG: indolepyruvate oxidoreductase subunit beta [Candidatus Riflebacteria bacterium]|nr:indolepyruvate oxidoreductase subunit beta [Candidatus Riflebacteria bacterium]